MRQLLEAGAHFGHQSHRWNPKMKPFIFGKRNLIHIIDVRDPTLKGLIASKRFLGRMIAAGKDVVFVGTKRQARSVIEERVGIQSLRHALSSRRTLARRHADQLEDDIPVYFTTVELDEQLKPRREGSTRKERLMMSGERDKLRWRWWHQGHGWCSLSGVRHRHQQGSFGDQGGQPPQRFR